MIHSKAHRGNEERIIGQKKINKDCAGAASDHGSNLPYTRIFTCGNLLYILLDLESSKKLDVSRNLLMSSERKSCSGKSCSV